MSLARIEIPISMASVLVLPEDILDGCTPEEAQEMQDAHTQTLLDSLTYDVKKMFELITRCRGRNGQKCKELEEDWTTYHQAYPDGPYVTDETRARFYRIVNAHTA